MKKVIIGMLLILPLIIVAAVALAMDVITIDAYIAVDRVELNESFLELPITTGKYEDLEATVYPFGAYNKEVIWSIENQVKSVDYEGDIASVDEKGVLTINSYGTFDVVCTTVEGNKRAVCSVYIYGDKPESVTLSGVDTLATGQSGRLQAVFYPVDAVVRSMEWTSSSPDVLTVDHNGIITARKAGNATVTVRTGEIEASRSVTVTEGIGAYGETVYIASDTASIVGWGLKNPAANAPAEIIDGILHLNGQTETVLSTEHGNVTVCKVDENEIVIQNASFFTENYQLKVGRLPLTLTAEYLVSGKGVADVHWSSSDPEVATIDAEGRVTAIKTGAVTLIAERQGHRAEITVQVQKPVSLIRLDKNAVADQRGILQKTVYGNKMYNGSEYRDAEISFNVLLPTDADKSEFIYECLTEGAGEFVADGILRLSHSLTEPTDVTVRVTAKVPPYESVPVFAEYTLHVVPGVNVDTPERAVKAAADGYSLVLQSNLDLTDATGGIVLTKKGQSLYGNGYIIDGQGMAKGNEESAVSVFAEDALVSNVTLRSDAAEKINQSNGLQGSSLLVGRKNGEWTKNVRVEYSILENAYYCLSVFRTDITVDGCIVRNSSNFGIRIPSEKVAGANGEEDFYIYSNVVLNNMVMSNIVAPAVGIMAVNNTDVQSTFKSTGFLDIYNWQPIDSMRLIDRDLLQGENNAAMNAMLRTLLKNVLTSEFAKDKYAWIRFDQNDTSYIHLGVLTAGALQPCTTVPEIEDERYVSFDVEILHDRSIIPITMEPVIINMYDCNAEIKPDDQPLYDGGLYRRLRGE